MILSQFIREYREGVKAATGANLSTNALSKLLGVDVYRLQKWEQGKAEPKDDKDRLAIKIFFGLEEFHKIKEVVLKEAIARYPKGLGEMKTIVEDSDIKTPINYGELNSQESATGEEETTNLSGHKNEELSMRQVLDIMRLQATAYDKDAEARLFSAKSFDRLSAILERMEQRLEAHEGLMAVKRLAD